MNTPAVYEKLMQEHEVIQANIRFITNSTENLLLLFNLQDDPGIITTYQVNYLSEKRLNLKRAISSLKEGLLDHNLREENVLRSVVGESLLEAIKRSHKHAVEKIAEIDWILLNISPMGILFNSSFLKQKVDNLNQTLESDCLRENSVLELLIKIPVN